jgi:hypothetical protein
MAIDCHTPDSNKPAALPAYPARLSGVTAMSCKVSLSVDDMLLRQRTISAVGESCILPTAVTTEAST